MEGGTVFGAHERQGSEITDLKIGREWLANGPKSPDDGRMMQRATHGDACDLSIRTCLVVTPCSRVARSTHVCRFTLPVHRR